MDDTSPDPASSSGRTWPMLFLRVPIYLFVFLFIYVLSIGPMYWFWYESYAMYDSHNEAVAHANNVSLFYLPLVKACDTSSHVSDYINWYIDFWV